ncbi:MAG: hypothetical protein ACPHK8_05055 [Thermoplasmatota archaeon]
MRWIVALLIAGTLAGCASPDAEEAFEPAPFPLEVYRHAWTGSDVFVPGVPHGLAFSVHNPTDKEVSVGLLMDGHESMLMGPLGLTSGDTPITTWLSVRVDAEGNRGVGRVLAPGEGTMFLAKVDSYVSTNVSAQFLATDPLDGEVLYESHTLEWAIVETTPQALVTPGTLVQTTTVGLWINGTSFYTNSAQLLADPMFPAGGIVDRNGGTETLPIYVYENANSEQPYGNADNCYFTTIPGYNGLLKSQAGLSTGVTFMQPSQGYTVEGNEGHPLFGDALVFLNTIVAIDGSTELTDALPDPSGACFDPTRPVGTVAGALPVPL